MHSFPRFTGWGQTYHQDTRSSPRFTGWGQTYRQVTHSSPRFPDWGQTYHRDMHFSPRFTGWEVKPTIRTCVLLHALRVESSNLPSGHAFFCTLYGWRGQTYHEDKRSSPRFTGWEVKPTIRSCVLLHALRVERSNLPSGHRFLSTLYGSRGQTYHQDMRSSPRFTSGEVKPTMRTNVLLHASRVERSNLPSGLAFFSTLYGLRGQTYHEDKRSSPRFTDWGQTYHQNMFSSPRFTGWEVKPSIRTCVLLHALRVERSNLPSRHAFLSTLYGWEFKPTIRTCFLLHALRVER